MPNFDKTTGVNWSYFDKFTKITNELLPDRGEGDSFASQIVTAVNKLVYKWYNDGDVFDNTHYLEGWVNDLSSYANWLYKYVPETRAILNTIEDAESGKEYEILLKDLADKCLNEKFLKNKENMAVIDTIYGCDGKFEFYESTLDEEDEDYYEDEDDSDEEM